MSGSGFAGIGGGNPAGAPGFYPPGATTFQGGPVSAVGSPDPSAIWSLISSPSFLSQMKQISQMVENIYGGHIPTPFGSPPATGYPTMGNGPANTTAPMINFR